MPLKTNASKRKALEPVIDQEQQQPSLKKKTHLTTISSPVAETSSSYSSPVSSHKSRQPSTPSKIIDFDTITQQHQTHDHDQSTKNKLVATQGTLQFQKKEESIHDIIPMFMPNYQAIKPEQFVNDKNNAALWKLNQHMNIFFPSLYSEDKKSNLKLQAKVVQNGNGQSKTFLNIYYLDRSHPQQLVSFMNVNLIQFTLMTPFAAIRYCSPFPLGTHKDKWNDPEQPEGKKKEPSKRVKLPESQLSFEMTNRAIDTSNPVNQLMDQWFDYAEHIDSLMMYAVAMQLEELFPTIYAMVVAAISDQGQQISLETIIITMKQMKHWVGMVNKDKNGVRKLRVAQKLFRYANVMEKAILDMPDYESQSKHPDITRMLKKSLYHEDMEGNLTGARWEQDIPVFRCRSTAERQKSQPSQLFEQLDYSKAGQVISTDSNVISTVFSLQLTLGPKAVHLKPEVKAYIWLGVAPGYVQNTNFELPDPMNITFDSAPDPESQSQLLLE